MASDSARGLAAFGAFGVFSAAYVYAMARAERARDDRERVLVLVSGDGFTSASLDAPSAPATFVGCALVRGVKMYIDPKLKGCREYVDPKDGSQRVNPALVCSGDDLDANVYECYAVEPSAVLRALRGEPRMLGLTTDTVLVDLDASETSAKLSRLLKRRAQDEHLANGGTLATVDYDRAALLTFVAHRIPRGAVPAEPAYAKDDGTRVFEWTACVGAFAEGVDAVGEDGDGAAREKHARALERATRSAQRNGKWLNESDPYGAGPGTLRCRGVTTRDAEALAAPETEPWWADASLGDGEFDEDEYEDELDVRPVAGAVEEEETADGAKDEEPAPPSTPAPVRTTRGSPAAASDGGGGDGGGTASASASPVAYLLNMLHATPGGARASPKSGSPDASADAGPTPRSSGGARASRSKSPRGGESPAPAGKGGHRHHSHFGEDL